MERERAEELAKNVKTFDAVWSRFLKVASFLNVRGIPETVESDEQKNEIVKFYERMWNSIRNRNAELGQYVNDTLEKYNEVIGKTEWKDGVDRERVAKAYKRLLAIGTLDEPHMRKLEEVYVAARNYQPQSGFWGIYFVNDVEEKMKREGVWETQ